ncbi:MAG TPA: sigma-70 family RNA polymerase sigma factor [Verrucomicrobiae bacterium]|nr:sigma-70 family RNA polymerase sigma factor [Verrucomicrobiae bacterium]
MSVKNRSPHSHNAFRTTQWTRVLQARGDSDESRAALSDLCEAYYAPVFTFIRAQLRNEDQARDLTQEFFARLLKKSGFSKLDPARGRFRSYLLAAVKHFLSDMRDREAAAKRNPGQPLESLQRDTSSTEAEIQIPDPNATSPDIEFDRKWAMTLLDRALTQLAEEHKAEGKQVIFDTLKPWLTGDTENILQSAAASALAMNESTLKVSIHRLRRRFRDAVKTQIAATLPEPDHALVTDELSYLLSILR